MPKLIWLYSLIGFSDSSIDCTDGILNGNPLYRSVHKQMNKFQGFPLQSLFLWLLPMSSARLAEMRTGRKGYHHIPSILKVLKNIPLNMLSGYLCREQVATPSIMPFGFECLADYS